MPAWGAFVGVCSFLALAVVSLSRASAAVVREPDGVDAPVPDVSAAALFANVGLTHGTILVFVAGAAVLAGIPADALGATASLDGLAAGVVAGVLLAVGNELLSRVAEAFGVPYSDALRELLTPATTGGWVVLLAVVLPLVALAEELLFRGALVGALAAGFGTPLAVAVAFSSLLFGLAHGAQGVAGVVVAALLGGALAVCFLWTDSLLAVVVAHYVVNANEFVTANRWD